MVFDNVSIIAQCAQSIVGRPKHKGDWITQVAPMWCQPKFFFFFFFCLNQNSLYFLLYGYHGMFFPLPSSMLHDSSNHLGSWPRRLLTMHSGSINFELDNAWKSVGSHTGQLEWTMLSPTNGYLQNRETSQGCTGGGPAGGASDA